MSPSSELDHLTTALRLGARTAAKVTMIPGRLMGRLGNQPSRWLCASCRARPMSSAPARRQRLDAPNMQQMHAVFRRRNKTTM